MQVTRRAVNVFLAGAATGAFSLPVPSATAATDTLIIAMPDIPRQLDPLAVSSLILPAYRLYYNLYDHLIAVDYKDGAKMVPGVATEWTRIDDRTIELTLRPDVKFHDGSTLTAEDVAFTFGELRMRAPDSPGHAVAQNFLSTIESVTVIAPDKVRVVASKPDPVLELRMSAWGSQIISKAAFEKAGSSEAFGQAPIGTGPYKFESLTADEIRLTAHADYWGGKPHFQTIVFKMVPELSSRIAGIISKEFHLITDLSPDQFSVIEGVPELDVVGGPIANLRCIKFDGRNPQLKDPRIRRALSLAIDRKAIVDSLWAGKVEVARSHQLAEYGAMYLPDHPLPEYNPELAKQLLAEAGYKGEVIPFRPRNDYYALEIATSQILASMWQAVGINTSIEIKETWGQVHELPGVGIRNGSDPALVLDPLFSLWRSYGPAEREQWVNEEFWALGAQLETVSDVEERKKILSQMLVIFDNDPPATVLHTMGSFYAKVKDLDWTPYPQVYMDFRSGNASMRA